MTLQKSKTINTIAELSAALVVGGDGYVLVPGSVIRYGCELSAKLGEFKNLILRNAANPTQRPKTGSIGDALAAIVDGADSNHCTFVEKTPEVRAFARELSEQLGKYAAMLRAASEGEEFHTIDDLRAKCAALGEVEIVVKA